LVHVVVGVLVHSLAESAQVVSEGQHEILLEYVGLNVFDVGLCDIPPYVGVLAKKVIDHEADFSLLILEYLFAQAHVDQREVIVKTFAQAGIDLMIEI